MPPWTSGGLNRNLPLSSNKQQSNRSSNTLFQVIFSPTSHAVMRVEGLFGVTI
jgi:hypothetical protein